MDWRSNQQDHISAQTQFVVALLKGTIKALAIFTLGLVLIGCDSVDGTLNVRFETILDFKRSEVITNSPGIADGQSELIVVIQLTNSDGTPVKFFRPKYEITAGGGVIGSECTESNANGVSTCILRSSLPGVKSLSVTNIKIKLKKDVLFALPAREGSLVGLNSGGGRTLSSPSGHSLLASFGNTETDLVKVSPTNWKLYGGPIGNAISE